MEKSKTNKSSNKSSTTLEHISVEELDIIKIDLEKYKTNPQKSLPLLKSLLNKNMTFDLLKKTKIGKTVVAIQSLKENENDEVVQKVKKYCDKLIKRWKKIDQEYKQSKSAQEDKNGGTQKSNNLSKGPENLNKGKNSQQQSQQQSNMQSKKQEEEQKDKSKTDEGAQNEEEGEGKSNLENNNKSLKSTTDNPQRNANIQLFVKTFNLIFSDGVSESDQEKIFQLSATIENEVNEKFKDNERNYFDKIRSLLFNLRDAKNAQLKVNVYIGQITPKDLVAMPTKELASETKKAERIAQMQANLDEKRSDWQKEKMQKTQTAGMFQCFKCKSKKTYYFQMQTRSADEPMTNFVTCLECGNQWKCY